MKSDRKENSVILSFYLAVLVVVLIPFIAGSARAKSVYLIADHHSAQFDAWEQKADGTLVYQATYNLNHATDPAGVTIWQDPTSKAAYLFVTTEAGLAGVELVDAVTMDPIGTASADSTDLAGIDIDDNNIVYSVLRYSDKLYVYHWDPSALVLNPEPGSPFALPNCTGAFGLALGEGTSGILWVADPDSGVVRAYDVSDPKNPAENTNLSFVPSHKPIDIAVDTSRNLVYTVSMNAGAYTPPGAGSNLLSKYDLVTRTETTGTLSCQGVGIAVDEVTGYAYVTVSPYCSSSSGGEVQVWDTSSSPWVQVDAKMVNGSPAGIAIANVSVNPLNLTKNDIIAGGCAKIGRQFAYEICCDNTDNPSHDAVNVSILDTLPKELDFVSASHNGNYNQNTHSVSWDIGTIPAGQSGPPIDLVVKVNHNGIAGDIVYNYATIQFSIAGDDYSTTVMDDENSDDPNDELGTPLCDGPFPGIFCSVLGNDPRRFAPDQDIFTFRGTEGEVVTVRLESDPPEAGSGKRAMLVVRNKGRGLRLFKRLNGLLPHEVAVVLPVTDEYHVIVAESPLTLGDRMAWGERYEGDYCVTLEGPQEIWDTFEEFSSVE
jgi:uncharacterized repeat protein (TIGR01451 family)